MSTKRCLPLLALLCVLGGCFDVSDEVWWNADGSAKLRRTVRLTSTAEVASARATDILNRGLFHGRDIRIDPRVKSFDVKTSVEGQDVVAVEELEVKDWKELAAVQKMIASKVVVEGTAFDWFPALTFEVLPTGNVKFLASIVDVKPPASFDRAQATTLFGERVWSLKLYGPSIASASPASAKISEGVVEWKTPIAEIAGALVKENELLAEIGPAPGTPAGVIALVVLAFVVLFGLALRRRQQQAALAAAKPARPPAPRTMPTATESGAIPIVGSDEALLSDASEINVDDASEVPIPAIPLETAQAAADAVIKFKCPKCTVELKIPLNLAGRQGKCRKCGGAFVAPVPGQLKEVRAAVAATPPAQQTPATLREAFSVKKVKCSCGMTSAVLKGREGTEKCPACDKVLVLT